MSRVLVTGASGFVGRHLLTQLEADSSVHSVVVLVRQKKQWAAMAWTAKLSKVVLLEGGLHDTERWQHDPVLDGLSCVFHLAAMVAHNRRQRSQVFHVNVDGSVNVAIVAKNRGCRLVYVSTSGTVGCFKQPGKTADEGADYIGNRVGGWPYYASKIEAELRLLAMAEQGLDLVVLRPPIMLGPGDHRYRSTGLLLKFLGRKLPMVIRGGFPMVDVRDAAGAMLQASKLDSPQRIYHLPGEEPTIDQLFAELERISGVKAPTLHLPASIVLVIARLDEWLGLRVRGEPLGLVPDPVVIEMGTSYWGLRSLYAERDLNFKPRTASKTLEDTVAWLQQYPPSEPH